MEVGLGRTPLPEGILTNQTVEPGEKNQREPESAGTLPLAIWWVKAEIGGG